MNFKLEFIEFLKSIPIGFEQLNDSFIINNFDLEFYLATLETFEDYEKNRLIIRKSDWFNKKEIVQSKVLTLLNKNVKIHGRQTKVKRIESVQAKDFLEINHLKGYFNSKVKYGCFFKEELMAVMTFGTKRRFKKEENYTSIEMIQFASKIGFSIVGGLDKMLNFAENNLGTNEIMTYLDLEQTLNNNWTKLGFEEVNTSMRLTFEVNPITFETKKVDIENENTYQNLGNKKMIRKNQNLG